MKIDASFRNVRSSLNYTLSKKEKYKEELLSLNEEDYGLLLVRVAAECMFLLDQSMEVVWSKIADLEKKKTYIKFPVVDNADALKSFLKRSGLDKIEEKSPELFKLITSVQPFDSEKNWLYYQHHIASERHSDQRLVYEYRHKNAINVTAPGLIGQDFSVSIKPSGGVEQVIHFRRYGIPDREPPKATIKSKDEAINFIERCVSETNVLIIEMIDCFERHL